MAEPKEEAGKGTGSVLLTVVGVAVLVFIVNLTAGSLVSAGNIAETDFDFIEQHLTVMERKQNLSQQLNANSILIVNDSLTEKINVNVLVM